MFYPESLMGIVVGILPGQEIVLFYATRWKIVGLNLSTGRLSW